MGKLEERHGSARAPSGSLESNLAEAPLRVHHAEVGIIGHEC
jgi:hypothetical protein